MEPNSPDTGASSSLDKKKTLQDRWGRFFGSPLTRIIIAIICLHVLVLGSMYVLDQYDLLPWKAARPAPSQDDEAALVALLGDTNAVIRLEAVTSCGQLAAEDLSIGSQLKKALLAASRDSDSDVRTEAVIALARFHGEEDYVARCLELLADKDGGWSRLDLYTHIGKLIQENHPELAYLLGRGVIEEDDATRALTMWMLHRLCPQSIEALWKTATTKPTERELVGAMTALAILSDEAIPLAVKELDGPRRHLAMDLLGRIAADGIKRSPRQWKKWDADRQADEDPAEQEEEAPSVPLRAWLKAL